MECAGRRIPDGFTAVPVINCGWASRIGPHPATARGKDGEDSMTFSRLISICSFLALAQACGAKINGYLSMGSDAGGTGAGGDLSGDTAVGGGISGGGISGGGTSGATSEAVDSSGRPCDILERTGNPCVAAHSTVRLLSSKYSGPLYQVQRADYTVQDIVATADGYADAAFQDSFCSGSVCTVRIIYDQSEHQNDLTIAPPGGAKGTPGNPARAAALKITINGHSAYGLKFDTGMGYRKLVGNGTAQGDDPETEYMVTSQQDLKNGCCFDYGNAETDAHDDGNGTVEAVYFGGGVVWGRGSGNDTGPWVMADLENGLYAGWENSQDRNISTNTPLLFDFVTAVLVGDTQDKNNGKGRFALYGGDATQGTLQTMWDGIRPEKSGYVPMQKQGSIILSVAGDNSDADGGRFYEGVMASGAATKATVDALQANIVAAAYGSAPTVNATSCPNVMPCGGDVVGIWTVQSSCLAVSGTIDMTPVALGCTAASLTSESLYVSGTLTLNADRSYSDNTTTMGTGQIALPANCKLVSGTTTTCSDLARAAVPVLGYDSSSSSCTDASNGGCSCTGGVKQSGGVGVVSGIPGTSDSYATSGNVLSLMNTGYASANYQYCVSGNTLTLTPQTTGITTTGTIVLRKP